jgi:uncharacterized membrane protein
MWKSPWIRWGIVLGFALGGFFDGILLHQILQWHHLLSLVPGLTDIRLQILWDGYFHVLMYLIAAVGLWGLWRAHGRTYPTLGRALFASLLVGFGLWHVVDALLSHWALGIHRIKLDSPNPLAWDLIWLFVFGVIPLMIGWMFLRGRQRLHGATMALLVLTATTVGAAAWSLRPPPGQPFTTVVFRPDVSPADVFAALASLEARLVWTDSSMGVVVVDVAPDQRWRFYTKRALLVSGSAVPAGCLSWSRT